MSKRALLLLPFCLALIAADWPQWRGPDRTDVSKETGLLKTWPKGGPKLLWTHDDAGVGYAGFAVVGDRLYSMGATKGKNEYLFALDVKTGKRLWTTEIGTYYSNNYGGGPRGTPTVDGDFIYALGGQGNLICVKAADGKSVWSKSLSRDLDGGRPNWGYTESPLVDGDKVVVTPGGTSGTMAALDKKTGAVIWRSKDWTDSAAYHSTVIATIAGTRQYVQMTSASVAGIGAADGKLLWRYARRAHITVPTPICFGNFVYVTSGYGAGCNLIEIKAAGNSFTAEEVYANKSMQNHHGGVVLLNGHIFGYCDRNGWVCQLAKDGSIVWQDRRALGKGSITYADGHFYCYSQNDGTAALIDASTTGWKERGRFTIPERTKLPRDRSARNNVWTHPVVANGKLYLRDQEYIFCYDIKDGAR